MEASRSQPVNLSTLPPARARTSGTGTELGISLVVPICQEEHSLLRFVRSADEALAKLTSNYEILLVANRASDAARAAACATAREIPAVRIVWHAGDSGYGAALRSGCAAANEDYVLLTDGEAPLGFDELGRVALLAERCDVVCGCRTDRHGGLSRRASWKTYGLLASILLATRVRDCHRGLKLVRRASLQMLDLHSNSAFIVAELVSKARRQGLSVVAVDIATAGATRRRSEKPPIAPPRFHELMVFWWTRIFFPGQDRTAASTGTCPSGVRPWHVWLLTAVAALLFFARLTFPLVEPDEARYALIGAGMFDSGNLLIPSREGADYLDKPPLLYWLTVASYHVLGVHDYAARTVTALAGLGTFLATYWIGRRMVGDRGALSGALLLLLSLGFVLASRFLIMDGLLTFFTTVSFLSLYLAVRGDGLRHGWWLLAALACGLGVMSKGPVAVVLVVPPLLAWRWLTAAGARVRVRDWMYFAVAVGAIAAPWYVAVTIRDPGFLKYFFWDHHVKRFLTDFNHVAPWWFYGFVLFLGMFPASMLLPVLGGYLFRRSPALVSCRAPAQGFLLLACLWTLVFFSLSTCKLAPYILPATPPMCLLLGAMLDGAMLSEVSDSFMALARRWMPFHGTRIALIAGVLVGIAAFVIDRGNPRQWIESALLIVGSVVLFWYVSRKAFAAQPARWFAAAAIPLAILAIVLVDIYPTIATRRSLALRVAALRQLAPETPIVFYGRVEDSLMFYNRDTQVGLFNIEQVDQLRQYLQGHPRALLISQIGYVSQLRAQLPSSVTLEEQPSSRGKLYVSSSSPDSSSGQPESWAQRQSDPRR